MNSITDSSGAVLSVGDQVMLLEAPSALLSGLPSEDLQAIRSEIGKTMTVQDFDEQGNVELEFGCSDETVHFIWVAASSLRKENTTK